LTGPDPHIFYHLHTPQRVTDRQGRVVWQAGYDPFGEARITTNTIAFPLRFPGQYADPETGLRYNWHRVYDLASGRYLTSDPIGLEGGANTYSYVGGNPLNRTDPDGLLFGGKQPDLGRWNCLYGGSSLSCMLGNVGYDVQPVAQTVAASAKAATDCLTCAAACLLPVTIQSDMEGYMLDRLETELGQQAREEALKKASGGQVGRWNVTVKIRFWKAAKLLSGAGTWASVATCTIECSR
jgi:RHS repeat-associated protein